MQGTIQSDKRGKTREKRCWAGKGGWGLFLTGFILSLSLLDACTGGSGAASEPSGLSGAQLARTHCGSCHQYADPSMLPGNVWAQGVLPKMGWRFGILSDTLDLNRQINEQEEYAKGVRLGVYPGQPTLHRQDWLKIVRYYAENAPDSLSETPTNAVPTDLTLFRIKPLEKSPPALVTWLHHDPKQNTVLAGMRSGMVYRFDGRGQRIDSLRADSPPSDGRVLADGSVELLQMGIMDPNDDSAGSWVRLRRGQSPQVLIPNLRRPVSIQFGDLNKDGREDALVSQFGHLTGRLSWFENGPNGYRERIIDAAPGARQALIRDMNGDGWPDVVALLTQGDEQIAVFLNNNGSFVKTTVRRFPPMWGSSSLDLTDVDRDGDMDLVVTNGDNADFSYVLKPYHGVRLLLNVGQGRFIDQFTYPMHGATQALARDFDQDGDTDIAAIAFFPDFTIRPVQTFVYLENTGNLQFRPRTFAGADRGRWLTMTAADVDRDGDDDLLLGSFFKSVTPMPQSLAERWVKGPGVVWLENRKR